MQISELIGATSPRACALDALQLASLAAALDPELAKGNPARAVERANHLFEAAQSFLERLYRGQIENHRQARERERRIEREIDAEIAELFVGEELPVPEAFRRWPSDYKKERAFAVALKRFGLSYSKPIEVKEGIGIVFAEYTTQKAVAQVGTRKKTHDRELNRKSKHKTRQRKKTKKRLRTPARRKVTIERKDRTH